MCKKIHPNRGGFRWIYLYNLLQNECLIPYNLQKCSKHHDTSISVVSRYMDRFETFCIRNLVTLQPLGNIFFQNLRNHCNLWNFATFSISLKMT